MMKPKRDWIIHYCANGVKCSVCGKREYPYLEIICDAHTHGMERYHHLNFQTVLDTGPSNIGYLLNRMGCRVQAGERFAPDDLVSGLFTDCQVRLDFFTDPEVSEQYLRLIIPDRQNRWPEDPHCDYPYNMQTQPISNLRRPDGYHEC